MITSIFTFFAPVPFIMRCTEFDNRPLIKWFTRHEWLVSNTIEPIFFHEKQIIELKNTNDSSQMDHPYDKIINDIIMITLKYDLNIVIITSQAYREH